VAVLYVAEFAEMLIGPAGRVGQVPAMPPLAEQTVAIGGASAPTTNAFNAKTRMVRLHTDAICSVAFGTAPTATSANMRLAANQTEYVGVPLGASYKVAVITNT
jgi:hypothetical protein